MKSIQTKETWIEEAKLIFGEDVQMNESSLQQSVDNYYQFGNNSWIIKALSIFGGIMAFGSFLGFIAATNIFEKPYVSIVFGLLLIAFTIFISKSVRHLIIDTSLLCSFFTGFVLVGVGLDKILPHAKFDDVMAATTLFLALLSFLFSSRFMITFFSLLIIEGSAFSFILIHDAFDFLHLFFAINVALFFVVMTKESYFLTAHDFLKSRFLAARYAILTALWLANYCWMILSLMPYTKFTLAHTWISSTIALAPLIWLMFDLGKRLELTSRFHQWLIVSAVVVLTLPTIHYPAIAMSLMIMMFSHRIHFLLGVISGALALVFFIGQFYYDLHYTLLEKSYMMLGTGILFIGMLLVSRKKIFSHEEI